MYVFVRLLLLHFVSDASFIHPSVEVEDNYTAASSSSLLSKTSVQVPIGALSRTSFSLWLRFYDGLPHEHLQNFPYSFIIILSSTLDIVGQITLLAASLARCF